MSIPDDGLVPCEPELEPTRRGGSSRNDFMLDPLPPEAQNISGELSGYGRERFEKVIQGESVRQIIEQGADWDTRAFEDWRAVKNLRVASDE